MILEYIFLGEAFACTKQKNTTVCDESAKTKFGADYHKTLGGEECSKEKRESNEMMCEYPAVECLYGNMNTRTGHNLSELDFIFQWSVIVVWLLQSSRAQTQVVLLAPTVRWSAIVCEDLVLRAQRSAALRYELPRYSSYSSKSRKRVDDMVLAAQQRPKSYSSSSPYGSMAGNSVQISGSYSSAVDDCLSRSSSYSSVTRKHVHVVLPAPTALNGRLSCVVLKDHAVHNS